MFVNHTRVAKLGVYQTLLLLFTTIVLSITKHNIRCVKWVLTSSRYEVTELRAREEHLGSTMLVTPADLGFGRRC